MKRFFFMGLAVILTAGFVFAGGQQDGDAADAEKEITIWTLWSDPQSIDANSRAWFKALDAAETEFPNVTFKHDSADPESYKTKIKTAVAANEVPDIFYVWGAGFAQPFVDAGKILQIDSYLDSQGIRERLVGGSEANFIYDGKTYGLPFGMQIASLYCNRELFNQNGLEYPETYDELISAVKTFRDNDITPIIVGEKDLWPGMFWYDVLALRTAGAELCNQALRGEVTFDRAEFIDAARKLVNLVEAEGFDENMFSLSRDESEIAFLQGDAAMYFMGSWFNGSIYSDQSSVAGKIDAIRFPVVSGGKGDKNEFFGGAGEGFMIDSETDDPDLAVEIMAFLAENMARESYILGSGLPTFKVELPDDVELNQLTLQVADLTESAEAMVIWWDVFLTGDAATTHKNLVAELFGGTITPEEYAEEMAKIQ
ncbi:MAG: extracellular solute-binding protein [Spirochaetia bacterium]